MGLWEQNRFKHAAAASLAALGLLGCSGAKVPNTVEEVPITDRFQVSPSEDELKELDGVWRSWSLDEYSLKPYALYMEISAIEKSEDRYKNIETTMSWAIDGIFLTQINTHDRRSSISAELSEYLFEILESENLLRFDHSKSGGLSITVLDFAFFQKHFLEVERPRNFHSLSIPLYSYLREPYVPNTLYRDDSADACLEDRVSKLQPTNYQVRVRPVGRVGELFLEGHQSIELSECRFSSSSAYHGQPRPYKSRVIIDLK